MCMVWLESSFQEDMNSEPNSYQTTNFSISNFSLKFYFDRRDFSVLEVRYIWVSVDLSLSELFIFDVRMYIYDIPN